ncbi:MAG: hypothetical protein JO024_01040 [Candidatus Eremiobacteraeota bacterium]|nr:hypothetical protein [Candidatus Eremiobacteraeota bacterium]
MKIRSRAALRFLAAGVAAFAFLAVGAAAATIVATLAGSGAWGAANGSAAAASFMMPAGVALDRTGDVFITDAQAQQVRELSPSGVVRTVAGGPANATSGLTARGGYRDGAAAIARFNHPLGIAIDRFGDLYVADTLNHCIRKVARDGTVSTYAGTSDSGYVNGPRLEARFRQPEGVAVDRVGNVYVADVATGLRKISSSGEVTTIDRQTTDNNEALAVGVYDTDSGPLLYVAERFGLSILHPDGSLERFPGGDDYDVAFPPVPKNVLRIIQARRPIGFPTAVAAIDDHTVAFTDARTNSVRILETVHGTLRIVGGAPNDDASGDTGGLRNGNAANSLFNAPIGIAARGTQLVVADSGNRRIRSISGLDYRHAVAPALGLLDTGFASGGNEYRIAYVGNSSVWYNTGWDDSIEGILERTLNGDRAMSQRVHVVGVAGNEKFGVAAQYAEWLAKLGGVNLVVLNLNSGNLLSSFAGPDGRLPPIATWQPQLTARLRDLRQQLARNHVPLVVVTHPFPNEFDWSESAYTQITQDYSYWYDDTIGKATNAAVRNSGANLIDLWPKFSQYERHASHGALFGGDDFHFSRNGRQVVGEWVAQALERLAPWR